MVCAHVRGKQLLGAISYSKCCSWCLGFLLIAEQVCVPAADHLRDSLESLFNHYNVDLVLSGHVHSYARTCNVFNEKCVDNLDKGTTHVTLGCGGRKLSDVDHDQYNWLAYARVSFGYGRVSADGDRSLRLEYITTANGHVHDSVVLHNDYDGQDYCRGRGHRRMVGPQHNADTPQSIAVSSDTLGLIADS